MILAIDPGTTRSAYVRYENGVIHEMGLVENQELFKTIRGGDYDSMAIEMIQGMGMAVGQEVFNTCFWIGRYYQAARDNGTIPRLLTRREEKLYLCGSMRAKDQNIRQALIDKLGKPGTKKAPGATYGVSKDVWSALAVAITATET